MPKSGEPWQAGPQHRCAKGPNRNHSRAQPSRQGKNWPPKGLSTWPVRVRPGCPWNPKKKVHGSRRGWFMKGKSAFQKWQFCMGGVIKIEKTERLAPTKRALPISSLASDRPAPKKIAFRADGTHVFSSLGRSSPAGQGSPRSAQGLQVVILLGFFNI